MATWRFTIGFAASVFVAGDLAATVVRADDPPAARVANASGVSNEAALATQIHELVDELQAIRRERLDADKRQGEVLAGLGRQIDVLQGQLEPSERAAAEQRDEIARLESLIAADNKTAADASAWINRVADRVAPFAERARRRIERSAAEEAAARAADLGDSLKLLGDNDPQRRGTGASDAIRIVGEGWAAARSVSVTNEPVALDGGNRMQHAWVYRLGLASKAFVSEDGHTVGIWSGDPQSPWRVDLAETEREQVRRLLDVVRERQPPAVVPLPILRHAAATERE